MLLWIPTAPGFTDCLDDFENQVWSLCFDGQHTQTETAEIVHRRQGSISKIQDRCVRKMNDRYRALRSKDELPIAILAWMKDCGANTDIRDDTFTNAVHLLRLRERALRRGNTEKATTGSSDLDGLQIKNF